MRLDVPGRRPLLAVAVAAGAVALVVVAALALSGVLDENGQPPPPGAIAKGEAGGTRLVERVRPGIVLVTARDGRRGRSGTGFMIDEQGSIVTSRQLVAGARTVGVHAEGADGRIATEVVGTDAATGIALLKIPRGDAANLEPLRFGDDQGVRIGEPVIAVGAPFGLEGTVTAGVVSAVDRRLDSPEGAAIDGVIQIDAAVGPGNSGGPLIDGDGRVVGVGLQARAGRGPGFALPIGTVRAVVETMREQGSLSPPSIGFSVASVGPGLAQLLGLRVEHGLLVRSVSPGGPADRAGIRPFRPGGVSGDIVVTVDGQAVREARDVATAIADREAGDRIAIELVRGRRDRRVRLTLAQTP